VTGDEVTVLMERVMGIEPTYSAWEADVLPLNYTRVEASFYAIGRLLPKAVQRVKMSLRMQDTKGYLKNHFSHGNTRNHTEIRQQLQAISPCNSV
jgi:hypothetical protein